MSVVAVICARGGSKGIPRKNIRSFAGHPLIAWTIGAALTAEGVDHVVLSSEDDEILAVAEAHGALTHRRPDALATDEAATEPVVIDVLKHHPVARQASTVVLMQATSPLTSPEDLDAALQQMAAEKLDSMLSVVENHVFQWSLGDDGTATPLNYDPQQRPRRQDIPDRVAENGAFYLATREVWESQACRLGGRTGAFVMQPWQAWEIDTEDDWMRLEALATERGLAPA
ncbi:MAG TPA: acylneuraminate cytidylyltransferase family protein [Candidatus Poseidoniaceae archaeon]|nr:MAG TPA: acylneuraminate cytidylyltransferase family protein [Candidatus Poseidoniales archaeon]HIH52867.1 acylneuraminate cytidylyltransferase family protein [Candidatus Poseidoniaceae archaeon]